MVLVDTGTQTKGNVSSRREWLSKRCGSRAHKKAGLCVISDFSVGKQMVKKIAH